MTPNTKAILLLTAPLIAKRGASAPDILTPGEYKCLARHLLEIQRQPADLVSPNAGEILRACHTVIDKNRLQRLLERGFLLSQVVERWQSRAIWVFSRADAEYPSRLKVRLRENAPAVLYGCGDIGLLDSVGLAVVGSRYVNDTLIDYATSIGKLSALAGKTLVSGGAKGIDQAAMRGALETGGKVCGVLADSLEKTVMNREHRNLLLNGQLVLISPYDPNAGFNVGNAMQRNKLIYALADVSLVVNSDFNKGGTWTGAVEQLDKLQFVPVYVRSTGDPSIGLDALRGKGAIPWPNPQDAEAFEEVFNGTTPPAASQSSLTLFHDGSPDTASPALPATLETSQTAETTDKPVPPWVSPCTDEPVGREQETAPSVTQTPEIESETVNSMLKTDSTPADILLATVREVLQLLLKTPMQDREVAAALNVSRTQAKAWLQRLDDEGVIEKQKKPSGYIVKQPNLLE
jgi:predicted Rossmann fold nucleotide-binding protein DprA/Smf involved in DNA uptake